MLLEETLQDLRNDLGLNGEGDILDILVAGESKYIRDLRMNLRSALNTSMLSPAQACLMALAIAVNERSVPLINHFRHRAAEAGASGADIAEAMACASLLSANNVIYRFRHFASKEAYRTKSPGLRMNIMMKPVTGKLFFELMSLAVSSVNGCEQCVCSHEASVLQHGGTEDHVWESVKIAAAVVSVAKFTV